MNINQFLKYFSPHSYLKSIKTVDTFGITSFSSQVITFKGYISQKVSNSITTGGIMTASQSATLFTSPDLKLTTGTIIDSHYIISTINGHHSHFEYGLIQSVKGGSSTLDGGY